MTYLLWRHVVECRLAISDDPLSDYAVISGCMLADRSLRMTYGSGRNTHEGGESDAMSAPKETAGQSPGRSSLEMDYKSAREHSQEQQGHDVGDLDHRVHRRAGRVLIGIADGVASDRGLVGFRALEVLLAFRVGEAIFPGVRQFGRTANSGIL
jgi:hypothetical protein